MKYLTYLKYFLFIAFNWNFRLAWFTLYHEIKGEKKYGLDSSGLNNLKRLQLKGDRKNAEIYQGANYFLLEKLFTELDEFEINKSLVDFGSGKGRVMIVASYFGFKSITGVEFAKELCATARKNIIPTQVKFPEKIFNVIHLNAADYQIRSHENVFFFFNPFNEIVMKQVVKNILNSLRESPREVYVLYINPVHQEIFLSAGFEQVFHYEKYTYIQASILMKAIRN